MTVISAHQPYPYENLCAEPNAHGRLRFSTQTGMKFLEDMPAPLLQGNKQFSIGGDSVNGFDAGPKFGAARIVNPSA